MDKDFHIEQYLERLRQLMYSYKEIEIEKNTANFYKTLKLDSNGIRETDIIRVKIYQTVSNFLDLGYKFPCPKDIKPFSKVLQEVYPDISVIYNKM